MPRTPRCHFPEYAFFHVTSKGAGGIFFLLDDFDRDRFLALLTHVSGMFDWRLHAWCLMGTHYHLLISTPKPNLAEGIHRLNSLHAQVFNDRHEQFGHVFRSRYQSVVSRRRATSSSSFDYWR